MQPVIRLNRVAKRYGDQVALRDMSFDVPAGVVFALLGENGAGKSTAIRILLGLVEADSGQAEVLGFDSRRDGLEIRRRVGYVAERPTLYEWMTVAEIGWFVAGFFGGQFLSHYEELVRQYDLPRQRKIKQLSKGMRAKVSLALALAHDPQVLLLDEPTSGLDTLVRREFLESMVELTASGKTVLLSSHQIGEVERVADYVAIVRDGDLLVVEQLDTLKARVRELTVTLADGASSLPRLPGEPLISRRTDRQLKAIVADPRPRELEDLDRDPAVAACDVRTPSLEEIFVAYLKNGRELPPNSAAHTTPEEVWR